MVGCALHTILIASVGWWCAVHTLPELLWHTEKR
jgi:hypothetical protein